MYKVSIDIAMLVKNGVPAFQLGWFLSKHSADHLESGPKFVVQ
jgi:hypothetical protein